MFKSKPSSSKLPFLWGTATSSHQIEGNNRRNDWWDWEKRGMCEGGARSSVGPDHWNLFREDLKMARSLGLNAYRFSIEWSRVEPEQGEWDEVALDRYRDIVLECESLGLVPMVTLHHFTSPLWFAKKGGFLQSNSSDLYLRFVHKVLDTFGDRVPLWCTVNEPMVLTLGTYVAKVMPPGEFNVKKASILTGNLLRCHARAYHAIHEYKAARQGRYRDWPVQVGFSQNMIDFLPERVWHPLEASLMFVFHRYYNLSFIKAALGLRQRIGIPFLVPYCPPVPECQGKCTADFIGMNYYTKCYIRFRPDMTTPHMPAEVPLTVHHAKRKEPKSDLDWAIHPRGLRYLLESLKGFKKPIYITENGIADRDDSRRPDYIRSHLKEVARAIGTGVNVQGYFHWSLIDNFEWVYGYGPRFGLTHIDYETRERTLRPSAQVYESIVREIGPIQPRIEKLIRLEKRQRSSA